MIMKSLSISILTIPLLSQAQTTVISYATDKGSLGCPCIESSSILAAQSDCFLEDANSTTATTDGVTPGILVRGECLPLSYGSSECKSWDMEALSLCSSSSSSSAIPAYCSQRFCYVDPEQCRDSQEHFYQSDFAENLYYSYSTCGSSAEDWRTSQTIEAVANMTLTAAIPTVLWPTHYKSFEKTGQLVATESPEAYDNTLPWEGYIIEYINAVMRISNIHSIRHVHKSKGSLTKRYAGSFTQAVTDVEAGIVDLAVSTYWVTTERLALTPFTTPFATDAIKLWVPQPDQNQNDINSNLKKLSQPFSYQLWVTIGVAFLTYVILSVMVSPKQFQRQHWNNNSQSQNCNHIVHRTFVRFTDSLNVSALEFLGGGVDSRRDANSAQKWLNVGFAVVTFITISAYTANLAAFLTIQAAAHSLNSIEEAIAANVPICSSTVLEPELKILYPRAQWVFRPEFQQLQDAYDQGLCGGLVMGWVEIRADPKSQKWYCDRGLVRVGNVIVDKLMAFPVNPQIVGGLSHWIVQAQTQGIFFENYVNQVEQLCPLESSQLDNNEGVNSDLNQLTVEDMIVPMTLFAGCCIMALVIHLGKKWCTPDAERSDREARRPSVHFAERDSTAGTMSTAAEEEVKPFKQSIQASSNLRLRRTNEINSVEGAEQTMEDLMAYQRKLFLRMKHLSQQDARGEKLHFEINPRRYHRPGSDIDDLSFVAC